MNADDEPTLELVRHALRHCPSVFGAGDLSALEQVRKDVHDAVRADGCDPHAYDSQIAMMHAVAAMLRLVHSSELLVKMLREGRHDERAMGLASWTLWAALIEPDPVPGDALGVFEQ
jgi:hypothetical protein